MEPHGGQAVVAAGEPLGWAPVVIMVHGRNAGPANILDLLPRLNRPQFTYLAPTAAGRTWYPFSFMADRERNEPSLSSALAMLEALVAGVESSGVPRSRIVLLGFSQGACLTAEFAVRHPARYGGIVLFTGGLIGPDGTDWDYPGTFDGTRVFFGSGDPDSHVPVSRVLESAEIFKRMGAEVTARIYPSRGHWVSDDEIAVAQTILDRVAESTSIPAPARGAASPVKTQFVSEWSQTRVVFGTGAHTRLASELDAFAFRRVLMITTPGRANTNGELRAQLGGRLAGVCAEAAMHVPVDRVRAAVEQMDRLSPDALLAYGGGSSIGLAKAAALERPLPIVAIPTTYSGSEMTAVWGVTEDSRKRTGRDSRVAPRLVLYDPALTLSLPPRVSAASGLNAIAHAVEAMYAADASPIAGAAAECAIRALSRALPAIVNLPDDLDARTMALRGAHEAGVAMQLSTMGLHHRICHVLGGTFGLPHAETHAAVLPRVVAFNAPAAPAAMNRIAGALGAPAAAEGLRALVEALGLSLSLRELGLRDEDIPQAAELVVSGAYPNPRPATAEDVRRLLTGETPA